MMKDPHTNTHRLVDRRIRDRVGLPWREPGSSGRGFCCFTLCSHVYSLIARHFAGGVMLTFDQRQRWNFPIPDDWSGSFGEGELLGWFKHWEQIDEPEFGAAVCMKSTPPHTGVVVMDRRGKPREIVHSRQGAGVVIQRIESLSPLVAGYYRRRIVNRGCMAMPYSDKKAIHE